MGRRPKKGSPLISHTELERTAAKLLAEFDDAAELRAKGFIPADEFLAAAEQDALAPAAPGTAPQTERTVAPGLFQEMSTDPVNELQIDDAALQAEAASVAQEFAPPPSDAPPEMPAASPDTEAGYEILAVTVVAQGAAVFVPAWELTQAEVRDLSDAIVRALVLWFPDGMIPAKYMAVLAILGVGLRIAEARRDPVTGQFKPTKYAIARPATAASQPRTST